MIIKGKTTWCSILGKGKPGFDKDDPMQTEWSFDLSLTPETKKILTDLGLKSKIKNKGDDRGDFFQFKKKCWYKDRETGKFEHAKPINVVDGQKKPWDQTKLIGNGSTLNVSFTVKDETYGSKPYKKILIGGVQVWEHVPYEGRLDFPTNNSGFDTSEDAKTEETWD